jgi:CubicO group peptidase (beta-lactamase class C family)/D-alanyl-D-alanine dipeptidase
MATGNLKLACPILFLALLPGQVVAQQSTIAPTPKYQAVALALEAFVKREMADKEIPAISIALVDDQTIVWARGFGLAQPKAGTPATAQTVYRIGSVSKLFTDLAIMQQVEQGKLDLDAPVSRYLPNFKPRNPSGKSVTLRHLMTHRSGLVDMPPVGNYFDPRPHSLAEVVESLNQTELLYPPGTRLRYSNAGVSVAGRIVEQTAGVGFAQQVQRALLDPAGMKDSAFEPTAAAAARAEGTMWTYHGRTFDAPVFALAMAPAGGMWSTVADLGRFLTVLFAGGKGPGGAIIKRETLEAMWRPHAPGPGESDVYGLGFRMGKVEDCQSVGHDGAVYGFGSTLQALPEQKLGVVVLANKESSHVVTMRIAQEALKQMLAARRNQPLPVIERTTPIPQREARRVAGCYRNEAGGIELYELGGKLYGWALNGGNRMELREQRALYVVDDMLNYGTKITIDWFEFGKNSPIKLYELSMAGKTYRRVGTPKPEASPPSWAGLIGEYGWDHNILYILEREGKLHALIEWFFLTPLEPVSESVFKFPDHGPYDGQKVIFKRDASGKATEAEAAGVVFKRRHLDGEDGSTFRITPREPLDKLRRAALTAQPPKESGDFLPSDLVDVAALDNTIKLDIRYATTNNFLSTPFYASARAFMQRPAAEAVVRVHKKLAEQGYGLLLHDCYRPWYVTKMFWDATPDKDRIFVADPAKGSRHNRGCAVDLTLYELKTGRPVQMVGGYDEFSDRSFPDYLGGTSLQRWHRTLLRQAMEAEGFTVYEAEWWHFDYKDWRKYGIGNLRFEQIPGS